MKQKDEIEYKLNKTRELLKDYYNLDKLQTIVKSDMQYQIQYQRYKVDDLINQRKNIQFQGLIDDDVALRFINTFKKDLENLIVYPEQKTHERSKDQKNAIYYLQNGTKNIFWINIDEPGKINKYEANFLKHNFTKNSQIVNNISKIYIFPNYDEQTYSMEDQTDCTVFHQLINDNDNLYEIQQNIHMSYIKHSFGVAVDESYIYLIGGFNFRDGALKKCEKISLKDNIVSPFASLKHESQSSACCCFNNDYIIKVGGVQFDGNLINQTRIMNKFLEIYIKKHDIWQALDLFIDYNQDLQFSYGGRSAQIYNDCIYIFGGMTCQGTYAGQDLFIQLTEDKTQEFYDIIKFQVDMSWVNRKQDIIVGQVLIHNSFIYSLFKCNQDQNRSILRQFKKKCWTKVI